MGGKNISMQQLKEQRLTPAEKFVLDKIKGLIYSEQDEFGRIRWDNTDGDWVLEQRFSSGYLWVSYNHIHYILAKEHGLNDEDIKQLLTKLLYKYTNNGKLKIYNNGI